jgi:hypothetical protein
MKRQITLFISLMVIVSGYSQDKSLGSQEEISATLIFNEGSSAIKNTALETPSMTKLKKWLDSIGSNSSTLITEVSVAGYSKPSGEPTLKDSERLATERAKETKAHLLKMMGSLIEYDNIKLVAKTIDIRDIVSELRNSNHRDKELIIRIIETTQDPIKLQSELQSIDKADQYLKKEILPKLIRSEIVISYLKSTSLSEEVHQYPTVNVKSDQEISSPLIIKVNSQGVWRAGEGELGRIELIDAEGNILAEEFLTADEEWMRNGPVMFSTDLIFDAKNSKSGKLVIHNNPSDGDGREARKKISFEIPVTF